MSRVSALCALPTGAISCPTFHVPYAFQSLCACYRTTYTFVLPIYSLMNSPASIPMANRAPETLQRPAPACMFSNGLPLPFDGGSAFCELVGVATSCACVDVAAGGAVGLGDAVADDGESVAVAPGSKVEVTILPVLVVLGPITIGIMISSVFPSLSVVVLVSVVVTVLSSPSP